MGLGRWRLLTHDLSKFSRAEWTPYVNKWQVPIGVGTRVYVAYDNTGSDAVVVETRESRDSQYKVMVESGEQFWAWDFEVNRPEVDEAFNKAWKHHYRNNSHHWEYWLSKNEANEDEPRQMGWDDRLEMLADWRAMGYAAKGYDETKEFYAKMGKRMKLHPMTRMWVEDELGVAT